MSCMSFRYGANRIRFLEIMIEDKSMGFLEEEYGDRRFPSEWELDELEKKQKESKRRNRRKGTPSLTEEEERLDNRDAWALQEDRHYQWLEEEHTGVRHRRPGRRKKKTGPE